MENGRLIFRLGSYNYLELIPSPLVPINNSASVRQISLWRNKDVNYYYYFFRRARARVCSPYVAHFVAAALPT
jgi:hypothetical protein